MVLSMTGPAGVVIAAAAGQVAVTEILNNPDGADAGREWVELFNFSRVPVGLRGWTLEDQDSDSLALPDVTLLPGGYLVVASGGLGGVDAATAKAVFETEWLGGLTSPLVVGAAGMALANGADEVVLRDPGGVVAWALAWADDETPPYATFLTEVRDFSVSGYGSRGAPGVDRRGDDNGVPGFPGYQQNDVTPDRFAVRSDISQLAATWGELYDSVALSSVGSPLAGGYQVLPIGDVDWDGTVGVLDLLALLAAWGPCPPDTPCQADIDHDGAVATGDLWILLHDWS